MTWVTFGVLTTTCRGAALVSMARGRVAAQCLCRRSLSTAGDQGAAATTTASAGGPSFFVPSDAAESLLSGQALPALSDSSGHHLQQSLSDLGLGQSWWPSDFALSALDHLHGGFCSLPWWGCALALGLGVRAVLLYPTLVEIRMAQQQQQEQQHGQPGRIARLTEQLHAAQAANNVAESRRLTRQLRQTVSLGDALRESPSLRIFGLNAVCQAGWLTCHLACLRALSITAALPAPGMQDLASSDATGLAPVLITCVMLVNVRLALANMPTAPPTSSSSGVPKFISLWVSARPLALALGPVAFFTFLLNCPGVTLFYFGATGCFAMATNLALLVARVRQRKGMTA